ncbi:MAG: CPBP family intramembrane metalloprotease [Coriobacteriia bacterium]|nr:CPBP family intramembrane metalloprotease [Coriobacteriia bacterium]
MAKHSDLPAYDYATFPREFVLYRWWKPLIVGLLTFVFMIVFQMGVILAAALAANDPSMLDGVSTSYDTMNPFTGPGALGELGSVAAMLPALALAVLIVRDRPFSSLSSSRGGWNWKAFAKCIGIAIPIYLIAMPIEILVFPSGSADGIVRFTLIGFIVCTIITPLQCVAEEYVFRGFILQTVGSWTKLPAVGIVVAAIAFAAGHPYNTIGVVSILINGLIWGYVVWKTKGLEASSAIHIVNNLAGFYIAGLGIESLTSEVNVASFVITIIIDVVYAVAVLHLGKRNGWFEPTADGAAAFNQKKLEKMARKSGRAAIPTADVPVAEPVNPQRDSDQRGQSPLV